MAKDDYFVLVYYILKYLYNCLKHGKDIKEEMIIFEEYPAHIESSYAAYIMHSIQESGHIQGVDVVTVPILGIGKTNVIKDISKIEITPKGIEYLLDNSMMAKAYKKLKKFKDIIPSLFSFLSHLFPLF